MFVCVLFCGFNGKNGTEALVWDDSSNEHSERQIAFYLTQTKEINILLLY